MFFFVFVFVFLNNCVAHIYQILLRVPRKPTLDKKKMNVSIWLLFSSSTALRPPGQDLWIGLNDIANEGTFVWEDGNAVSTSYIYNYLQNKPLIFSAYRYPECNLIDFSHNWR